ncbi:MAG: hypothetical protein RLZZ450_3043 [Pseudomonadota bacterium]|jgi:hypothetical protein
MRRDYWLVFAVLSTLACGSPDKGLSSGLPGEEEDSGSSPSKPSDAGKKDAGSSSPRKGDSSVDPGGGTTPCDKINLTAMATAPDMLIVLDRSTSMLMGRWDPSASAIKEFTAGLDQTVSFGLMLFPAKGGDICAPGKLDVPVGEMNAQKIATTLAASAPTQIPIGATPTSASLAAALTALDPQECADCIPKPKFVLLVTDGEPNCADDPVGDSNKAIDALTAKGVKTYVIGYNLSGNPNSATIMNGFAQHGGTDKYYPVEDQAGLVKELTRLAGELVPCEFALQDEIDDPSYVRVEIDGKTYNYGTDWMIDGSKIVLDPKGGACPKLRDAKLHDLKITRECDMVRVQ